MSNMSYCRFENTDNDLQDCEQALGEFLAREVETKMSRDEVRAATHLVMRCQSIVNTVLQELDLEPDYTEKQIREALTKMNEEITHHG